MSYYLKKSKEFFPMMPTEKYDWLLEYRTRIEEYFDNGKPNSEEMTGLMREIDRVNDELKQINIKKFELRTQIKH
jgi:uncharacterized coiled-coil DUF342 family protein